MRPEQRTDENMRQHTDDIVTAAGRHQPTDRGTEPGDRGNRPTDREIERADRSTERAGRGATEQVDRGAERTDRGTEQVDRGIDEQVNRSTERAGRGTERTDRGTERAEDQNRPERREMPRQRGDGQAPRPTADGEAAPSRLFQSDAVERFRTQWQQIQTGFVDDPRAAVQGANDLLAEVIRALAASVNEHKQELEGKWREASPDQTEDLRLALRRYRSFTNRLLEV